MEHILAQKTTNLVANSVVTLSWGANDFIRAFPESIVKQAVAMRLSCATTAIGNGVYVGVRYQTREKVYRVAERQSIGYIPPASTVELTPASIPALGLLNENITDIFVDLTSPVSGTVTISLILDDEPPPLSGTMEMFGLDARFQSDYIQIGSSVFTQNKAQGTTGNLLTYTVPAGKRAFVDYIYIAVSPSPVWPALANIRAEVQYNSGAALGEIIIYSEMERYNFIGVNNAFLPLNGGDIFNIVWDTLQDTGVSTYNFNFSATIREVF